MHTYWHPNIGGCFRGCVAGVPEGIDCWKNGELFLALASLRDDSDYMQWFTGGEDRWFRCINEHLDPMSTINAFGIGYHKATVEELIEHFKIS